MSEGTKCILALAGGSGLGTFFFVGLWWTVNQLAQSRRGGRFLAGSFVVRMTLALGGFYLAAHAGWKPLLACLLGFILARAVVARWIRPGATAAPPKGIAR